MADFRKTAAMLLTAALMLPTLSGCLRSDVSQPGETAGVARYPVGDAPGVLPAPEETDGYIDLGETESSGYTPPPLDNRPGNEGETTPSGTGNTETPGSAGTTGAITYRIENGKYLYSFPAADRSAMADTSWLYSVSKALFTDQGNDTTGSWYCGKVQRDLATGEVTYVWDRAAATVDMIKKYNGIYRQNEDEKVCYLTFDCGYENGYTAPLLDVLKEKNVPGIFFVTGQYVDTAGEEIRRMIDEGHIIGNHTENHKNATTLTPEQFREEIESVERKMADLYNYKEPMLYWRPPQGACNEYVLAMSDAMDLRTCLWSFAYYDYDPDNQPDYASALQKAKESLHPGCVFLFHTVSKTNSEIMGEFIDWIRSQGYEIRPICG